MECLALAISSNGPLDARQVITRCILTVCNNVSHYQLVAIDLFTRAKWLEGDPLYKALK